MRSPGHGGGNLPGAGQFFIRAPELMFPVARREIPPSESVLFAGMKSPEGKLVQQRPYHPRLYHFSPVPRNVSGTNRENNGIRPEQEAILRRELVRASIDALQWSMVRDPVCRPGGEVREGVSGSLDIR